ncbi:hypothetical protein AB1E18_012039 [Capra hircus]
MPLRPGLGPMEPTWRRCDLGIRPQELLTCSALTLRPCLLRVGRACDSGRVPPAEKRHQREAPASEGHFIPRDITGQLPVEQVSSASVESVHLRSWGQFLPQTRSPRPPRRRREK